MEEEWKLGTDDATTNGTRLSKIVVIYDTA
jgi:hypothetical protein